MLKNLENADTSKNQKFFRSHFVGQPHIFCISALKTVYSNLKIN